MSKYVHIVCPACDVTNRILVEKIENGPTCGKCQSLLFGAKPVALTSANFSKHIKRNYIPVIVDFWAEWCGPCKMMAPEFEQAASRLEPHFRLAKLDTESAQEIASRYAIRSIPTMILFLNGKEVRRQAGAMGAEDIIRWAKS